MGSGCRAAFASCVLVLGTLARSFAAEAEPGAAKTGQTTITYVTATSVYIDAGEENGLAVGDKVEVVREGAVVAVLEVTTTSSKKSVCARLSSDAVLQTGDQVRYTPSFAARPATAAVAIAPLVEPRTQRSGTMMSRLGLRGRIGVRYLAVQQKEGGASRDYQQPALDLRLNGTNVGGAPIDLGVDIRARRTYRTLGDGTREDESRTRVYSAYGAWQPGRGPFRIAACRLFSPSLAMVSIFDGIAAEYRKGGFATGLFTGTQPDAEDFGYSTDIREHGLYLEFGNKPGAERRWAVTTGAVASFDEGEVNREFGFVQGRYDDRRWSLYLVQEVDYNSDWKKEAEGESFTFTSTYAAVRVRATENLSFNAGYDNRRNVRLWRDFISPETEFDDRFRRGYWGGAESRFGRYSVGVDARRSEETDGETADAFSERSAARMQSMLLSNAALQPAHVDASRRLGKARLVHTK